MNLCPILRSRVLLHILTEWRGLDFSCRAKDCSNLASVFPEDSYPEFHDTTPWPELSVFPTFTKCLKLGCLMLWDHGYHINISPCILIISCGNFNSTIALNASFQIWEFCLELDCQNRFLQNLFSGDIFLLLIALHRTKTYKQERNDIPSINVLGWFTVYFLNLSVIRQKKKVICQSKCYNSLHTYVHTFRERENHST